MSLFSAKWVEEEIFYDGSQLRSHWIYDRFGVPGDVVVAFIGPCDVKIEHMIDVEDRRERLKIASKLMLHFIVETFDTDLVRAALRQRVLVARIAEELNSLLGEPVARREGSDLYDAAAKLTVSVATVSPVSSLIHAGFNIVSQGAPVPVRGLRDYGVDPEDFGKRILEAYVAEMESVRRDRCKVRSAGGG